MAGFIQIIEYQTSRIDEIQALIDKRRAQLESEQRDPATAPARATMTADRDRPGYYLTIIEFDSYESAMENSNRPETGEMAAEMAKLCDGPPTFYNLDISKTWQPIDG
ncbi:MAG TPA: hypothetical protein VNA67_00810 [Pseudonocardiaceae bacterium]|nr:hypothetical protein [Pseudonocardiaceae bacterium]